MGKDGKQDQLIEKTYKDAVEVVQVDGKLSRGINGSSNVMESTFFVSPGNQNSETSWQDSRERKIETKSTQSKQKRAVNPEDEPFFKL
ncbi:hypothetical protein RUM44_007155 [Polyplax serrata]|uniref:Uncharacterized protein n=1 Tax=Polyplax serrata TaxID=468196 RepID=A0ABR1AZX1_POLSC